MEGSFQVPEQYTGQRRFPQTNLAVDNVPLLFVFHLAEHRSCSVTQDIALL